MTEDNSRIELFLLRCAVIQAGVRLSIRDYDVSAEIEDDSSLDEYVKQFEIENRKNATRMSHYYKIFYMLENDIRRLIVETMEAAHGTKWWDTHAPTGAKDEAAKNRAREAQAAITPRSDDDIDYITFGQLWDVMRENWVDFAGMLSNQSAVGRVLSALNMLRGTIAHCGILAEDEVDRLNLAIKDWFRVLQGPSK
ncbi:MAG: hypothetical protein B7Z40_20570 [Bosea sp. 12-68-7]|nr:MAG: hypothetical protein B7Z40_20570 [Bosea sp. 12-68-7]